MSRNKKSSNINKSQVSEKSKHENNNDSTNTKKKKSNNNCRESNMPPSYNIGFLPPGVAFPEQRQQTKNNKKCENEKAALHEQFSNRQQPLELFRNRFEENVPIPRRLNEVSASLVEAVNDFHFAMMNDEPRNEFYYELLKSTIVPGESGVLEIGAGSGLLSMMAAKLGAKWVVAVEGAPEMAHLAQANIRANNLSDNVKVLNMLSTELTLDDLPSRPDILVSEIFGTLLLGESAHDYIADVKKRLLSPSTIVLPGRGVQYAIPIECPSLQSICAVDSWRGINLSHVMALQDTVSVVFTKQYGFRMSSVPFKKLAEPVKILEVDFNKGSIKYGSSDAMANKCEEKGKSKQKVNHKNNQHHCHCSSHIHQETFDVHVKATESGVAHAWLYYWNVFDDIKKKHAIVPSCSNTTTTTTTNNNNNNNDNDDDGGSVNKNVKEASKKERTLISDTECSLARTTISSEVEEHSTSNEKVCDVVVNTTSVKDEKICIANQESHVELVMSTAPWDTTNNFARDMQWGQALQLVDASDDDDGILRNIPKQLCMEKDNVYNFCCTLSSDNVIMHLQHIQDNNTNTNNAVGVLTNK